MKRNRKSVKFKLSNRWGKARQGTHSPSANSLSGCHNANRAAINEPQSCPITICSSRQISKSHVSESALSTHSLVHSDDVQKRSEVCREPSRRVLLSSLRLVCPAVPEHVWCNDTVSRPYPRSNLVSPAKPANGDLCMYISENARTIYRESRGRRGWCAGMMRRACGRQSGTSAPWRVVQYGD